MNNANGRPPGLAMPPSFDPMSLGRDEVIATYREFLKQLDQARLQAWANLIAEPEKREMQDLYTKRNMQRQRIQADFDRCLAKNPEDPTVSKEAVSDPEPTREGGIPLIDHEAFMRE